MRINARLGRDIEPQVHYLVRVTGLNLSGIVKKSIQFFYEKLRAQEVKTAQVLLKSGFIGSGRGEADLSQTYKQKMSDTWGSKHDHR